MRAEALAATPREQMELRKGRVLQLDASVRVLPSCSAEVGKACVRNVWKIHIRHRGRWREVDEDDNVWFEHGRLWRVHWCVRTFVRRLKGRADGSVLAMVEAGVTREEAGEEMFAVMGRAVTVGHRLEGAVVDAERRVRHLAEAKFWSLGGGKRKKRRKAGGTGGAGSARERKAKLTALAELKGAEREEEVRRRQRVLDSEAELCRRRRDEAGWPCSIPVPAWSRRELRAGEWRELLDTCADTREPWAATPSMGGPSGPPAKRRRIHYSRTSRLSDIYVHAGLDRELCWDGRGFVWRWVNTGCVGVLSYEHMDLSGVT